MYTVCVPYKNRGGSKQSMANEALPHNHGTFSASEQLIARIAKTEDFQTVAEYFKQLSDGNRLRIFLLLCHCEECVINISSLMDMSSPAVSHHLKQLKAIGLISSRRQGKEMYYKASDTPEVQLLHKAIEHLMQITCPDE